MSIDLRKRKELKHKRISLMDDWVFKAVLGNPEDTIVSFLSVSGY